LRSNNLGFPVLNLRIESPFGVSKEVLIRVDTGYDGFLLLSEERYRRMGFHLSELPRKYWSEGETVTGEVFKLRRALTVVRIPELHMRLEGYVDTFRGNTEDLVGLRLIEGLKLLFDGPAQRACIFL